jgi:hypothetical protein
MFKFKYLLCCISALACLLIAFGCGKDREETKPQGETAAQYTLTYIAGDNGAIEGASRQTVSHGRDGSRVTAVPAAHYHFTGWSDGINSADRIDTDVRADLTVTGHFAIDQHTLKYSAEKNGSIEGAGTQSVDHGGSGSEVTAVPAEGYHFLSWSDGESMATRTDPNVTADLTVTASFAVNAYKLTYIAGEHGTIEGAGSQTVSHGSDGSRVTAVPAEHYHFTGWSDGVTTESRIDSKVTADLKVTPNFALDQYTLNYTAAENGSIKGSSRQSAPHSGSGSEVSAVPDNGYHFVSWSDGVNTANRIDKDVTGDLAVSASFALNRYTLTYTAGENGILEGDSIQTVQHDSDGSPVTAVADEGYQFVQWSDGVTTPQRIDSKASKDLQVKAKFTVETYSVGGNVSGLYEGTRLVLQNNGRNDLEILTNGEFTFTTELVNGASYEVKVYKQPVFPDQKCTVTNGSGTIAGKDIFAITVTCVPIKFSIGGTVTGLPENDRIVLQNNGKDDLAINVNGSFTFANQLDDGSTYKVTVLNQPKRPNWDCKIENAAGTLDGMDLADIIIDCYPKAVLKSKVGLGKIVLTWNIEDFNEVHDNIVDFHICRAEEEIPPGGFRHCRNLKGGFFERKASSSPFIQQLAINTPYWFQLQILAESGNRRTYSEIIMAIPYGGLNDSGIIWCATDNTNLFRDGTRSEKRKGCETLKTSHPNQDAIHGRDASAAARKLSKTGTGAAGFDFTKICRNGEAAGEGKCPPNPSPGTDSENWACTRDNVTGLVWEIKGKSGLQDRKNTYTWYNPDESVNGGGDGREKGGSCEGSGCDTLAYVEKVNGLNLCGMNDWRMPTKRELLSIVNNSRFKPAIDVALFPNTSPSHYWTASPYAEDENLAWQVYFLYGEATPGGKNESSHIRLVNGRTVTFGLDNFAVKKSEQTNVEPQNDEQNTGHK